MRANNFYFYALATVAIPLVGLVAGCASNTPAFDGIANRGITSVSAESPFVGSNVFLAQEMERSLYLYKFIQSRGAPQAIQIIGDSDTDAELQMFYGREGEYYSAFPGIDPDTKTKEWIIRGPFTIPREHYAYVTRLGADNGGVFEVFGKRVNFGGPARAANSRIIRPAFVPTPRSEPSRPKRKHKSSPAGNTSGGPEVSVQGTPVNLDQEALFQARQTPRATATAATPSPSPDRPSLDEALRSEIISPSQKLSEKGTGTSLTPDK